MVTMRVTLYEMYKKSYPKLTPIVSTVCTEYILTEGRGGGEHIRVIKLMNT